MNTQPCMAPPQKPPDYRSFLDQPADDNSVEAIGNRIASLTFTQAKELQCYLDHFYPGVVPEGLLTAAPSLV